MPARASASATADNLRALFECGVVMAQNMTRAMTCTLRMDRTPVTRPKVGELTVVSIEE